MYKTSPSQSKNFLSYHMAITVIEVAAKAAKERPMAEALLMQDLLQQLPMLLLT